VYINDDGNPIWNNIYQIKGNVVEVFYFGKSFFILGTFSYLNLNNQEYYGIKAKTDETSVFILSIDNTGKKVQLLPVKTNESIYLKLVKFYDIGNIHCIAQKKSEQLLKENDFIHIIINNKLQVLYSN